MKLSNLIITSLILSLLISIASCDKKKNADTTKPIITMVEPTPSDTSSLVIEPEVHMEFTVTDDNALQELTVGLYDSSNNLVYTNSPNVSGLNVYPFHQHYAPSGITSVTPLKLVVGAKDESNNVETKTINFYIEP